MVFLYKRAGFFVIQIAITVTKIWCHADFSLVYQTRWKKALARTLIQGALTKILQLNFPDTVICCT